MDKETDKVLKLVTQRAQCIFLGGCVSGGRWQRDDLDMIIKYAVFRNGINWSPF